MSQKRGQVMVLGCVTLLILALSAMLSFSVSHAVHERIRLQSYADASAYSMAVVEARAMNYVAYSNRAIAATFVSMATAHAYVAAANSIASGPETGASAMAAAAALEALMLDWGCVAKLGKTGIQYIQSKFEDFQGVTMKKIEAPLNEAVENFVKMIQSIHKSQREAVSGASKFLSKDILHENGLKKSSAPCAKVKGSHFENLNMTQFACALESSPLDGKCGQEMSSVDERKRIMSNVVNASRPSFIAGKHWSHTVAGGNCISCPIYHSDYAKKYLDEIPSPTIPMGVWGVKIEAYMANDSDYCAGPTKSSKGDMVCAKVGDQFMAFPLVRDTPGFGWNWSSARIGSGQKKGLHIPGIDSLDFLFGKHTKKYDHTKAFKKMFGDNCDGNETVCFINYRMGSKSNNWGQPLVFFIASQDLNSNVKNNSCKTEALPWHLNQQGQVNVKHGARGLGTLNMRPQKDAFAASQAMVYFHRMNSWRAPPNLFEPYWRAKLHPFNDENFRMLVDKVSN